MTSGPERRVMPRLATRSELEGVIAQIRQLRDEARTTEAAQRLDRAVERAAWLKDERYVEQARLVLTLVVEAFPDHLGATHDLGALYAEAGNDKAAEPLLRTAWERAPGQAQITRSLARLLMRRGDLVGAKKLADASLDVRPGDSFALALAAVVAVERGQTEVAAPVSRFHPSGARFPAACTGRLQ